ncbi:hypothetical protein V502_06724 [Pseudogymnoascus sp. VKM F-4520 (FW-2644)]|nr:hypothetical protein V502_06724 [Pseudogymnoascus sp. VKM F-4520 (FW-2644)]
MGTPQDQRLSVLEVLEIGRDLVHAPPKPPEGVRYGPSDGYLRLCKATYAYTYVGKLRPAYWQYRFAADGNGKQILDKDRVRYLCRDLDPANQELPYTAGAKEHVYRRTLLDWLWIKRGKAVSPVMDAYSAAQGLTESVVNECREPKLKGITGTEIGITKLTAQQKQLLPARAQADTGTKISVREATPAMDLPIEQLQEQPDAPRDVSPRQPFLKPPKPTAMAQRPHMQKPDNNSVRGLLLLALQPLRVGMPTMPYQMAPIIAPFLQPKLDYTYAARGRGRAYCHRCRRMVWCAESFESYVHDAYHKNSRPQNDDFVPHGRLSQNVHASSFCL